MVFHLKHLKSTLKTPPAKPHLKNRRSLKTDPKTALPLKRILQGAVFQLKHVFYGAVFEVGFLRCSLAALAAVSLITAVISGRFFKKPSQNQPPLVEHLQSTPKNRLTGPFSPAP